MDKETLWILKKLSANEISAQSADRILRALKFLKESEESVAVVGSTTEEQVATAEASRETQEIAEEPLLGDDGTCAIENIPDGTELVVERAGNIIIRGWDGPHLRAEGEGHSSTVLQEGKLLKIDCGNENNIALYIPPAIEKISVSSSSGSIDVGNYPNDVVINSDTGDIGIKGTGGTVEVNSSEGNIKLEDCSGDAEFHIESDSGDIIIKDCYADVYVDSGTGDVHISGDAPSFDAMGKIDLKMKTGNAYIHRRSFGDISIDVVDGNVELSMEKLNSDAVGRLSVHKGNIMVAVPPSFGCELIARGFRERMYIELPVEVMEKNKNLLRGMLNGGGPKLEMLAPDGEIRLQALEPLTL